MEFIGIIGDRGSGKTNLMTKYLYDFSQEGYNVIANYSLHFRAKFMTFTEIRAMPEEIEDCIIGMDELGIGADSYDFFAKDVKEITNLIAQIRKLHCRVYYTVQRFNMIARRLRLQTDGFIFMEDTDRGNLTFPDGTPAKTHRQVCKGLFRARYMTDNFEITKSRIFNGRPYWQLYNTDQRVAK